MTNTDKNAASAPGSTSPTTGTNQGTAPDGTGTGQSVEKAKAAASEAGESMRTAAQNATDTVTSEATNYAREARSSTADELKSVASALRTAADELRSGSPQERTFSQFADGLADASEALRDKDLGEAVSDVNRFARQHPLAFLGGAALVGFAATRFAKASSTPEVSTQTVRHRSTRETTPTAGDTTYSTGTATTPAPAMGETI